MSFTDEAISFNEQATTGLDEKRKQRILWLSLLYMNMLN